MNELLKEKCDTFCRNYKILDQSDLFESSQMKLTAAGYYLSNQIEPDIGQLKTCREILRRHEGFLSDFRNSLEFLIICRMAACKDPEGYLLAVRDVYKKMHPGIIGDNEAILQAMTIVDYADPMDYDVMIARQSEIYKEMKEKHFFLTGDDDKPFASLMAVLGSDPKETHDRAEKAYRLLKNRFDYDNDTIQTLSHILSVSEGDLDDICAKVCTVADKLRKAGIRFGDERRAAILGTVADLNTPSEDLSRSITEADRYLKTQKPFSGIFAADDQTRHMFAVQTVISTYYVPSPTSLPAAVSSAIEVGISADIMMNDAVSSSFTGIMQTM